jgi:hypothetical protein
MQTRTLSEHAATTDRYARSGARSAIGRRLFIAFLHRFPPAHRRHPRVTRHPRAARPAPSPGKSSTALFSASSVTNGMDAPTRSRHRRARVDVSSTTRTGRGVHDEDQVSRDRSCEECLSGPRSERARQSDLAQATAARSGRGLLRKLAALPGRHGGLRECPPLGPLATLGHTVRLMAPQFEKKKPPCRGFWRRRRDSNPRCAFGTYSLSRGAPSASRSRLQSDAWYHAAPGAPRPAALGTAPLRRPAAPGRRPCAARAPRARDTCPRSPPRS